VKKPNRQLALDPRGFSLVELLVALAIGLILIGSVISVFISQTKMSRSVVSQSGLQNSENAISALLTPTIRSAGYSGCASLTTTSVSGLVAGGSPPLSTLQATGAFVQGYDAIGTAGSGTTLSIAADNSANNTGASYWSPALDATLVGQVETGSDVLVVVGATPDFSSIGVTAITLGSDMLTVQNTTGISVGQFGVVTDCLKSSVFQITATSATTINHDVGSGAAMTNSAAALTVDYPSGAQFIPLQQTAFFVGQGTGSQSTLMSATYASGAWTVQPLVPGVDSMQILYGTGAAGVITQYVPASAVTNWAQVSSIQLGFLIQGQIGSGGASTSTANSYSVLGTTITVPNDGRLRHVYQMTINLRN